MPDYDKTRDQLLNELVELRLENNRLKTDLQFYIKAIEESSQPFVVGNSDGSMRYCNNAFGELTGFSHKELHNKTWFDLTPPEWQC